MEINAKRIGIVLAAIFGSILLISIVLWGLMQWHLEREREQYFENIEHSQEVVVAAQDISEGTPFAQEHIDVRKIPEKFLPLNPIYSVDADIYLNMPLLMDIEKGSMILRSDFPTAADQ